ncbi:NHL repeat-containing protein, partial [Brevibacillus laterosporus]
DSKNNYYVTDEYNHRVQKFDQDGTYLLTIGTYGKGQGELALPQGIAISPTDEVYIADTFNNRIQVFTDKGKFERQVGRGESGIGPYQFNFPRGINFEPSSGAFFVADTFNNRIMKFDQQDRFLYTAGLFPILVYPNQVLPDGNGSFYVTDTGNNRIVVYKDATLSAVLDRFIGEARGDKKQYAGPFDVEIDKSGNIFVADSFNHRILKY